MILPWSSVATSRWLHGNRDSPSSNDRRTGLRAALLTGRASVLTRFQSTHDATIAHCTHQRPADERLVDRHATVRGGELERAEQLEVAVRPAADRRDSRLAYKYLAFLACAFIAARVRARLTDSFGADPQFRLNYVQSASSLGPVYPQGPAGARARRHAARHEKAKRGADGTQLGRKPSHRRIFAMEEH